MARRTLTPEVKANVLRILEETGNLWAAVKELRIGYSTIMADDPDDPEWKERIAEAKRLYIVKLEAAALRRAVDGVVENRDPKGPVQNRKYSDSLLMFLMRAADPAKYRQDSQVEIHNNVGSMGLEGLKPESRKKLREILEAELGEGAEG